MKKTLSTCLIITFSVFLSFIYAQKNPVKIGIIGNSITQGSGLRDPSTQSYPAVLRDLLHESFGDACVLENFGLTTTTMLKKGNVPYWECQQFSDFLKYAPDICFIMLGTNDTKPQNWDIYGSAYFDDYMAMIDTIRQGNPDTKFILAYPPPVYEDRWGIRDTIIVHGVIPAVDSVVSLIGAELVDFYHPLLDSVDLFPDKIHPNARGAEAMANIMHQRILEMDIVRLPNAEVFNKFSSQFLEIDGYKIHVETLGEGDPIFFFAGGPGNSHDYMQGNFGHYYTSHQVVFIDMLGRGKSDDAIDVSEYSIANDVHIAEEIRKLLGLGKISLLGHSYGTVVAQAYAVRYPEQVNRMVLINGFHSGEMWQANCNSYNHYAKTHFPEKWKQVDSLRAMGYVSSDSVFAALYESFPTKYVYYHNTQLKQRVPKSKHRSMNTDVYFAIIGRDADFFVSGSMMDTDFRKELAGLQFPTLIIAGRYDGVSTSEYAVQYKEFMPEAQFVMFEQSGHNPYLEEPKEFYQLLDGFLDAEL